MHVGLNLIYLVPGATGGTETYARELLPELVRAAPDVSFTAFINREAAAAGGGPWSELMPSVTVPVRASSRVQWVIGEQTLLPRLAAAEGVEVMHSLANTTPLWGSFRRLVTIHDLQYRTTPEAHLGLLGRGMSVLVPLGARRSRRIITDSAYTAGELGALLRVPGAKIDVVPLGVGTGRRTDPMPEPALRRWLGAGERPIVLCLSAKRPHKNLLRLLGAWSLIPAERRALLVIAGYPTAHEREIERRLGELSLAGDVRLLDWIAQDRVEGLYAAAAGFVFPSLSEGFGLPVLEAMARGLPVACSDRGALAEVAGDAALLFDPESEPAIAATIERLLREPELAARLQAAGARRAAGFSWQSTAAGTLDAYGRAMGNRPETGAA